MARRDFAGALALLSQANGTGPGRPDVLKKIAACERALGNPAAALTAINAALAISPRDPLSLLVKGSLMAAQGESAEEPYRAALAFLQDSARLPPALQSQVASAARYCEAAASRRADRFGSVLEQATARLALSSLERDRILGFVETLILGEATAALPGLSRPPFFEAHRFSRLAQVALAHRLYAEEYQHLIEGDRGVASPYVDYPPGVPLDQWAELNRSHHWRAAHLWRGGSVVEEVARRCPQTMAAGESLAVPIMPGRSPNLMFSILAPHTHIPVHTGVINARLVYHIPLVIPPECSLTVGRETRQWILGESLIFDDTLPHEAINGSDETRVVLIGDVWHPDLSINERSVLAELLS